ncbi:MAG: hypothetical protein SFY56_17130 [Bacteroidota bacterium]|nr:hypothetical protein [Bacteroidota bacterium]
MLKKDFIVRQLEEFGKVMAVIFGLKKDKDWHTYQNEINNAALKFTSFGLDYVESLNQTDFEKEILNHSTLTPEQHHILADLLFEKLNYYLSIEDAIKSEDLKQKCKKLYLLLQNNQTQNEFNLDIHYKLTFLSNL